jgi:hypothetical protein
MSKHYLFDDISENGFFLRLFFEFFSVVAAADFFAGAAVDVVADVAAVIEIK